jgi:hypothetical protein
VCQEAGLTKSRVMEPGATQRLQEQSIGSVELQIILPFLSVVICFSIYGFGEGLVVTGYGALWMPFRIP